MNMKLRCSGIKLKAATWDDIESVMPKLKKNTTFVLTVDPKPESGPRELYIEAENGNYRPIMMNVGGTGKSYYDPSVRGTGMIEIGGYDYDPIGITQDYDLIVRIIREFFHTGNVSPELWKPQPKKEE